MDGLDGNDAFIGMDEVHGQLQAPYHRAAVPLNGLDIMGQDGFTFRSIGNDDAAVQKGNGQFLIRRESGAA